MLTTWKYRIFSLYSNAPRVRTTLSHEFLLDCREQCGGVLMMGSLSCSSAVSPQMELKRRFKFEKLSMQWWERPLLDNMGKYAEN